MSTEPAHFTLIEGGAFMPTPFALSRWGDDQLNGPAVVGLAARALENHCGSEDFMPTRFTADLFRAVIIAEATSLVTNLGTRGIATSTVT